MNLGKKALIGNILLLVMELAGIIAAFSIHHNLDLKFYTHWSNVLGLIASILFIINYMIKEKNKAFNEVVKYFKLTSTICLTVTILVVLFMFVPMDHFNFYKWAIKDSFFSFHLLSPIIAFICFMFLEKYNFEYIKDTIIGMIFTIIYSVVVCILILCRKIPAPYPFLDLYAHSVIINILSLSGMFIFIILLTILFIFIKRKQMKNVVE